ncbi:tail fiber domain-containing protein [Streptomyces sp. TS71-3]|uniref:tail fiber domain-containing protein n=1 Tax=Streptomyces sp. TS71-3 TaxID=2733862 RepID=UPI0020177E78|nr:tail fiber domain-containing protein [Streptomyces sp. TS71-3]
MTPAPASPSAPPPVSGGAEGEPVDGHRVLDAVAALPISTWRYQWEPEGVRHLGPMAQDWQSVIGLGADGRTIPTVDAIGVLLTSVQALERRVRELEGRLGRLTGVPGPPGPGG